MGPQYFSQHNSHLHIFSTQLFSFVSYAYRPFELFNKVCSDLENRKALAGMNTTLQWLEFKNMDKVHILHLKSIIRIAKRKKREAMKQSTLDLYFLYCTCKKFSK